MLGQGRALGSAVVGFKKFLPPQLWWGPSLQQGSSAGTDWCYRPAKLSFISWFALLGCSPILFFWLALGAEGPPRQEFFLDNPIPCQPHPHPAPRRLLQTQGKSEIPLPVAPVPSRPHFSAAQEVGNGKSAARTPRRGSFLPALPQ